jgi:hypothetical protein
MYYLKHPNALMVDGNKSRASKRMLRLALENELLPHDLLNLLNNRGRSTFHIVEPHPASESNLVVTLELDLPAKAFIDPLHNHLLRTDFCGAPFGPPQSKTTFACHKFVNPCPPCETFWSCDQSARRLILMSIATRRINALAEG